MKSEPPRLDDAEQEAEDDAIDPPYGGHGEEDDGATGQQWPQALGGASISPRPATAATTAAAVAVGATPAWPPVVAWPAAAGAPPPSSGRDARDARDARDVRDVRDTGVRDRSVKTVPRPSSSALSRSRPSSAVRSSTTSTTTTTAAAVAAVAAASKRPSSATRLPARNPLPEATLTTKPNGAAKTGGRALTQTAAAAALAPTMIQAAAGVERDGWGADQPVEPLRAEMAAQ